MTENVGFSSSSRSKTVLEAERKNNLARLCVHVSHKLEISDTGGGWCRKNKAFWAKDIIYISGSHSGTETQKQQPRELVRIVHSHQNVNQTLREGGPEICILMSPGNMMHA